MIENHITTLKKHLEKKKGKYVLNRNRMGDSFAFDVAITCVGNAFESKQLSVKEFYKKMGMKVKNV